MSKATTLPVICLTLSLASCSGFARVESSPSCPQPTPSLLVPAPALSDRGQTPVKDQGQLLAQYAEDVGKYNMLRERMLDLQGHVLRYCLKGN